MSVWQSSGNFEDIAPCGRCGKDVVFDHDPPCPHGYAACPECGHPAVCADCRKDAELGMYASGVYDPGGDPFFKPERKAADDQPRHLTGFDPATNSYTYRRKP